VVDELLDHDLHLICARFAPDLQVVDELLDHVHTPRSKERVLLEDPDHDRQVQPLG
jgi:hypothetical protein